MTRSPGGDADFDLERSLIDLRAEVAHVARLEAEADMAGEAVVTEQANRRLRNGIAVAALVLMALQVLAANGIFAWYGSAVGWAVPSATMTGWMATTVVEVVSVVLVIVNHLFSEGRRKYA